MEVIHLQLQRLVPSPDRLILVGAEQAASNFMQTFKNKQAEEKYTMKKKRLNIVELMKENKEKIWNDAKEMEKIEKRIEARYTSVKKKSM